MSDTAKGRIYIVAAMVIFGTVGIFSKKIPLPSGTVALARSIIGLLFLAVLMLAMRRRPSVAAIKKNLVYLVFSGVCLGLNWLLFFAACRATTVPTATLAYYLAPAIMVVGSVLIFKERITVPRALAVLAAILGMVLASGALEGGAEGVTVRGIILGAIAAVLYASVVLINKAMRDINVLDKTACQFAVASFVLLPYSLIAEKPSLAEVEASTVIFLLLIGILHTGLAYALYFGSIGKLSPTSVGMLGYIDPIVSVAVSVAIFSEPISVGAIIGAVLIIGASAFSELPAKVRKEEKNEN